MKRRISIMLVLVAVLILVGGTVSTVADTPRGITGGLQFTAGPGTPPIFAEYNIREAGPEHAATGRVQFRRRSETGGWLFHVRARAICVDFGEFEGQPAAAYVAVIESVTGEWGLGPGWHLKYWALDGGTPGSEGDDVAVIAVQPPDDKPPCDYVPPPSRPFVVVGGNLVIHD